MITVKFFAQLREQLGCSEINLPWQPDMSMLDVMSELLEHHPEWQNAFKGKLLMACNQTMVAPEHRVSDQDEVAYFPPVTGG